MFIIYFNVKQCEMLQLTFLMSSKMLLLTVNVILRAK